ncbi:hypothetical protein RFI_04050 [Reticulomyxa filosa]|uniref:Kinesin motor domain-containing protein n=1 Tax=Reticulomyxa filosa TaxID=46433 RepID=X6P614_RETFI|nr:hypothetical protein RFI_04050 [Reticulomyxa filosa]|eukprot:ETO33057.1 hypothetical protein RFI_04050 [Reticulomyxa filosa]
MGLAQKGSNEKVDINVGKIPNDVNKENILSTVLSSKTLPAYPDETFCVRPQLEHAKERNASIPTSPPNIMVDKVEVGRGKKTPGTDCAQKELETIDDIQIIAPGNRAQASVTSTGISLQQQPVNKWLARSPIEFPPKKRPKSRGRRPPSKKNSSKIIDLDHDDASQPVSTLTTLPKGTCVLYTCHREGGHSIVVIPDEKPRHVPRKLGKSSVFPTLHKIPLCNQQHQHKHTCIASTKQCKSDLKSAVVSELTVDGCLRHKEYIRQNRRRQYNINEHHTFNQRRLIINVEFFEQAISSNIKALMQGHSSTIYSYGAQLIAGDASEESIQSSLLFQAIDSISNNCQATSFTVSVSAVEFYGTNAAKTKAFDLLNRENALASTIDEKRCVISMKLKIEPQQ